MKLPRLTPATWMSLLCGTAALGIVGILIFAKKPWDIGPPTKIKHFVAIGEWWAGLVQVGILTVLAVTTRWWIRADTPQPDPWLPPAPTPRWFWPLVLVAVGITGWCGLQRISFSVWDDEENSLRRVILGEFRHDAEGRLKFKPADWEDAFWNYRVPTNHQLQTLTSKAALTLWQTFAQPQGRLFTEPALRWPLLLAAMASVAALAALLKQIGFARAGVTAAFLLALHPWHIRYAVELRGYIFTLLLGPLMLLFLLRAISTGRWRWWLAFAAAEFALLYAYPGTLFMLVAANACGLAALWLRHPPGPRALHLPRMLVASTLAGMVWLQLMAPNLPQAAAYFRSERAHGTLDTRWHRNVVAHFLSGIPWNNSDNASLGYPELQWITGDNPTVRLLLFSLAGLLLAAGAIRLFTRRPAGWLVAIVLLVPALAVYALARMNANYLYEWYLIFALPGVCACFALAPEWPAQLLDRNRWGRAASTGLCVGLVAAFGLFSQPARHWLLTHPLQPIKDAILTIRPSLDRNDPRQVEILTASVSVHLESYDPHAVDVHDVETLSRLAKEADAQNKPLFVVSGNDLAVAHQSPDLRNFLFDSRHFEIVTRLRGFDPTLTQTILLYRSDSLPP